MMSGTLDPRLETALRLERFALAARYLAYFVLVPIFLLNIIQGSIEHLVIVTIALVVHNFFVHMVLWTRRYELFQTPLNFCIHLGVTSLIVIFTGAEQSEMYILYMFLLLGYIIYSRSYLKILLVTFAVAGAYGLIIGGSWLYSGSRVAGSVVFLKLGGIFVCGWLVATLSELLRHAEDASLARARALASSEATLRTILDSAADPIFVFDEDERITLANDKGCEFVGIARGEMLGRRFSSLLFDDGTLPDLLTDIKEKGFHEGEQVFLHADGLERTVDLNIRSFVRDRQRFFVVVAHDVSEQKDLQEAAHLANMNLNRLNRELQQVNELKTSMLKSLSQRIRSPLTAILGYIDLLLNEELGRLEPEQRKAIQTCRRSTDRVFKLINEAFNVRMVEMGAEKTYPAARETGRDARTF